MRSFTFTLTLTLLALLAGSQARVLSRRETEAQPDRIPVTIIQEPEAKPSSLKEPQPLEVQSLKIETPTPLAKEDAQIIAEEIREVIAEEQLQELAATKSVKAAPQEAATELKEEETPKPSQPQPAIKEEETKKLEDAKPLPAEASAPVEVAQPAEQAEKVTLEAEQNLKLLPEKEPVANAQPDPVNADAAVAADETEPSAESHQPSVRQAAVTQATPSQSSTTQQNFIQQLIQNSPVGQFLNQFSGQPQQQQPQQQPQADGTPAPTVPGFLNPQAAITSAQQAVQNAAQSVVNSTTQAFQGLQQFASNLGNQFQNTLSGLTGQQQSAESTTPRPPGPIQSFVSNLIGGNNATANANADQPQQQQGPLQGILSFLGGNRPQNANAGSPTSAPAAAAASPEKPVDDKIDQAAIGAGDIAPLADEQQQVPERDDATNEVRTSGEIVEDSFEEIAPADDVIVVNDDADEQTRSAAQQPSKEQQPLKKDQPVVAA